MSFSIKLCLRPFHESVVLLLKGKRRAIGIDLMSIGEFQFCKSVLDSLIARFPLDLFYIFHHENSEAIFQTLYPQYKKRLRHLPFRMLTHRAFRHLDLYITNEQFVTGPPGVYTLTLFHGQPSKGVTFDLHGLYPTMANDAFFLYGPLQRQALDEHLEMNQLSIPEHLSLFEIGYTKSDDLLNGCFDRQNILNNLGLDCTRKTILYAPAFNEGASLRECGLKILQSLCQLSQYNIIAKLPVDCLQPTSNIIATGGVNWFEAISNIENNHNNFKLFREHAADKALACSDVLITCVSSISFEFLALGKPVIFIDTPRFYETSLKAFFPNVDISGFSKRTTVNGGKEFGITVTSPTQLAQAIIEVLKHPDQYPPNKDALRNYLLYNPGHATDAAVGKIAELLAAQVKSQRPASKVKKLLDQIKGGNKLIRFIGQNVRLLLHHYGYDINRVGSGFLDAEKTVTAAKKQGKSVCEYLESLENNPMKFGRRDRIIKELEAVGVFRHTHHVCEIGTGTGRYLEKVIEQARPANYEVYETDIGWRKFLIEEYNGHDDCKLLCYPADGYTLIYTADKTCDLVHAHAVFIYLPLLQSLGYLEECVRVCRPGGFIVFDYFPSDSFNLAVAEAWLKESHHFPVVIPETLLDEFAQKHQLQTIHKFLMIYGAGQVTYIVWQKKSENN